MRFHAEVTVRFSGVRRGRRFLIELPGDVGHVALWPIATATTLEPNVGFRGSAEVRVGWQTTTREGEPRCDGRCG